MPNFEPNPTLYAMRQGNQEVSMRRKYVIRVCDCDFCGRNESAQAATEEEAIALLERKGWKFAPRRDKCPVCATYGVRPINA